MVGKLVNLRPWRKGVSGNPNGRPRGSKKGITAHLFDIMTLTPAEMVGHSGKPVARLIAEELFAEAIAGDIGAIRIILDRTEGKAKTQQQMQRQHQRHEDQRDCLTWAELAALIAPAEAEQAEQAIVVA